MLSEFLIGLLAAFTIVGPGALAPADPGCLESVAERRMAHGWGLGAEVDPAAFDVLLAVESCDLLGAEGVLIADGAIYTALVVDCQQTAHEPLNARGLAADVSRQDLGHSQAVVILWDD